MKVLLKLLDRMRPGFEEGGRFARFKCVFDAGEAFLFSPATRTSAAPHARDPLDIKRFMSMVIIGLMPCLLASIYFFGWRVLAVVIVSYVSGGIVEVIFAVVRKEEINEGFLVTGLVFPLILPPGLPLWMVAVGCAFGVLVGKELFGGTGRNLFNPALVGRCFLAIGYPRPMTSTWIEPGTGLVGRFGQYISAGADAVTAATPLAAAKQGEWAGVWDLLVGRVPGSIGETSALAILIGGIFLLATRVANWRTVAGILVSFAVLAGILHVADGESFGPVVWHLLAGGLLFGAFFMATDPVTSPVTNGGKWVYGIIIGVVTVLIRNLTGYVEGMMFAILLGNICAPLMDDVAVRLRLRRLANEG